MPLGTIDPLPLLGALLKEMPLQIISDCCAILGFGFTVTLTVKGLPEQAPVVPEIGVTV